MLLRAMVRVFSGFEIAIGSRCEGAIDKQFSMEMPRSPVFPNSRRMGNGKNFRASTTPEAWVSSRASSFFAERPLRPNGMSHGGGNSRWVWEEEREMGERLICDICRKEEGLFEIIKLAPLTSCERLVCGHWWHLTRSRIRKGTTTRLQECDCPDYIRRTLVA